MRRVLLPGLPCLSIAPSALAHLHQAPFPPSGNQGSCAGGFFPSCILLGPVTFVSSVELAGSVLHTGDKDCLSLSSLRRPESPVGSDPAVAFTLGPVHPGVLTSSSVSGGAGLSSGPGFRRDVAWCDCLQLSPELSNRERVSNPGACSSLAGSAADRPHTLFRKQ